MTEAGDVFKRVSPVSRVMEGIKMKKKIHKYIGMFALALSFLVMPLNIVQAETIDDEPKVYTYGDFRYEYVKDTDYIEIVGYIGTDEKVVYPSEIEGKKVYSISCHSTYSSRDVLMVKEVVIPNGVKKINGKKPA